MKRKSISLNNEAIATTIIALLREKPERPVTIGVHGDWGAGKSSILEMIEGGLANQQGVLCLKFNGWRFQGFEDAKIALIEGIVTGLLEKRPLLSKAGAAVTDIFRRIELAQDRPPRRRAGVHRHDGYSDSRPNRRRRQYGEGRLRRPLPSSRPRRTTTRLSTVCRGC